MDSDRGKKRAKKMEQRCHFKIIGSGSGFHYFLWQGASKKKKKKIPPVDELLFFIFYSQWKPEGTGLPIFPSRGTWEPVLWRTQKRAGWPEGRKAPSRQHEWRRHRGRRTLCVFNSDSVIFLPNGGLQSENLQSILILSGLFAWCSS